MGRASRLSKLDRSKFKNDYEEGNCLRLIPVVNGSMNIAGNLISKCPACRKENVPTNLTRCPAREFDENGGYLMVECSACGKRFSTKNCKAIWSDDLPFWEAW